MTGNLVTGYPMALQPDLFPRQLQVPLPEPGCTPLEYAEVLGRAYLAFVKGDQQKRGAHYMTPAAVARFMAESVSYTEPRLRVLDPGSGAGILSAAVCEAAYAGRTVESLHVDAYETDPLLAELTRLSLCFSRDWLEQREVALTFRVDHGDFVLAHATVLKTASHRGLEGSHDGRPAYDLVISNPPYYKIGKDDPRAVAAASIVHGQPNIYALFMATSAELLSESGRLVYIVPRSFTSGPYFKRFREVLFQRVTPTAIHLFESRKDVFANQTVLQENLILAARRREDGEGQSNGQVLVSQSKAADDLAHRGQMLTELDSVLDRRSVNRELSIPVCKEDMELVRTVHAWPESLGSLRLNVSTGPVVPFRATQFLVDHDTEPCGVPLLWMNHVKPMRLEWPLKGGHKPQWIKSSPVSRKLLVRDDTYVLVRRFSAKEERRRLVAAPLIRGCLSADVVGLENHLNYIRGEPGRLDEKLAYGLAALFNSALLDRYFRVSNGNTQVSSTELRAMPLPAEQDIRIIGDAVQARPGSELSLSDLDAIVSAALGIPLDICVGPGEAAR